MKKIIFFLTGSLILFPLSAFGAIESWEALFFITLVYGSPVWIFAIYDCYLSIKSPDICIKINTILLIISGIILLIGIYFRPPLYEIAIGYPVLAIPVLLLCIFISLIRSAGTEIADKKCHFCAKSIKLDATSCRFCGERFSSKQVEQDLLEYKTLQIAKGAKKKEELELLFCQECSFSIKKDQLVEDNLFCPECGGVLGEYI